MKEATITALEHYYEKQEIMTRECLLALKSILLSVDENIVHFRKYQIPFFRYKKFSIGFLWVYRKKILVGFVEDKKSFPPTAERKKDNVTVLEVNPLEDIPIDEIKKRFKKLIDKYNLK